MTMIMMIIIIMCHDLQHLEKFCIGHNNAFTHFVAMGIKLMEILLSDQITNRVSVAQYLGFYGMKLDVVSYSLLCISATLELCWSAIEQVVTAPTQQSQVVEVVWDDPVARYEPWSK